MNKNRYDGDDIESAYLSGMRKGRLLTIKRVMIISREFIHPKLMNSFLVKLKFSLEGAK